MRCEPRSRISRAVMVLPRAWSGSDTSKSSTRKSETLPRRGRFFAGVLFGLDGPDQARGGADDAQHDRQQDEHGRRHTRPVAAHELLAPGRLARADRR